MRVFKPGIFNYQAYGETLRTQDVKTRLISYERRYAERNAAWEEKLLLYQRSNE